MAEFEFYENPCREHIFFPCSNLARTHPHGTFDQIVKIVFE